LFHVTTMWGCVWRAVYSTNFYWYYDAAGQGLA
jgi:hypothetical protein